jgi:hypothetical protein
MHELMKDPQSGDFTWRRLAYVFSLDDPRGVTPMPVSLTPEEREQVDRFVSHTKRLATTSLLGAHDKMQVNIADFGGEEFVQAELSEDDVTTGFMVLMRQCYANDEKASYSTVRKVLERRIHEAGDTTTLDVLKKWRKAHARLLNNSLEELVQEQLIADGKMPAQVDRPNGPESTVVRDPASPAELLRTFWYGDQVHWGSMRQAHAAIQADAFESARWEIAARQAATDFAHFLHGISVVGRGHPPSLNESVLRTRLTTSRRSNGRARSVRPTLGQLVVLVQPDGGQPARGQDRAEVRSFKPRFQPGPRLGVEHNASSSESRSTGSVPAKTAFTEQKSLHRAA